MRGASALALGSLLGCGEIERADLVDRPRFDDFGTDVQPLLEELGCSRSGACHLQPYGELKLTVGPNPEQLQQNYLGVKSKLDLDTPEQSLFLIDLLPAEVQPGANHPEVCWETRESCAWRKIAAWIAWQGASDPRPSQVECELGTEACRARSAPPPP